MDPVRHRLETSTTDRRLGSGWISGVFAVALGLTGLGAVLCIRYPEVLTVPEAREVYDLRLIRPLVFVSEEITTQYAAAMGCPVIPCGCSERTGTVRKSIRGMFKEIEVEHPHMQETLLTAMGNINPARMLDVRYLDLDGVEERAAELLPILSD